MSYPSTTDTSVNPSSLIAQAESQHWNVSGSSVLSAWGLALVGSILIATLYSLARRSAIGKGSYSHEAQIIYMPRLETCHKRALEWKPEEGILSPQEPEFDQDEMLFSWLNLHLKVFAKEVAQPFRPQKLKDHDLRLLKTLGLDALTYIQFLRMLRWLFACTSVFVAIPLAVANYYLNTETSYGSTAAGPASQASNTTSGTPTGNLTATAESAATLLDNLQLFTAANITGNGLWVHIGFEWIVSCLVVAFVVAHSWYHQSIVEEWISLNQSEISFKSLMITHLHIPKYRHPGKKLGRKSIADAKDEVCHKLGITERPEDGNCTVVLNHKDMSKLSRLIKEYGKVWFPKLERSMAVVWQRSHDISLLAYDSWFDRLRGKATTVDEHRARLKKEGDTLLGKMLIIQDLQEEARRVVEAPEGSRETLTVDVTSAFVTFKSARRAIQVYNKIKKSHHIRIHGWHVQRAPRAENIIWNNLGKDPASLRSHRFMGIGALLIVTLVNTVPLMVITVLANANTAAEYWTWLGNLRDSSSFTKAAFTALGGVIPALISSISSYALPYMVRWLDKWSGGLSRGALDKAVVRRLYWFEIISSFVIFSLLGILYEAYLTVSSEIGKKSWVQIYQSLGDVPTKITNAYISESSYWLSWFPIRAALAAVDLLQIPKIGIKLYQTIRFNTASELKKLVQPQEFEYAIEYTHMLFAMVVAMVYVPLAPIVVVCATLYFWSLSIVQYNTLMYVEDSEETDGKLWHTVRNRLLAACVFMQLLMALTVALKTKSPAMIAMAVAPCSFVLIFNQLEKRTNMFPRTSELVSDDKYGLDKPIPHFEHVLLSSEKLPELQFSSPEEYQHFQKSFGFVRKMVQHTGEKVKHSAGKRRKHKK